MKSKEELNALKAEAEALSRKLAELSEEELNLVTGGTSGFNKHFEKSIGLKPAAIYGEPTKKENHP